MAQNCQLLTKIIFLEKFSPPRDGPRACRGGTGAEVDEDSEHFSIKRQYFAILSLYSIFAPDMTKCEQYISGYASDKDRFSSSELMDSALNDGLSATNVNWTIRKMTLEGKLSRTGRGVYTSRGNLQPFVAEPDDNLKKLSAEISAQYPSVHYCLYMGSALSPLLHHLSDNRLTYLEVERELTEILFHQLQGKGHQAFLKPSWEIMQNYVDIAGSGIIVKPLISGSPLIHLQGVPTPTLEKLLVDTLCDDDFSYLRGGEWQYMLDNAFGTFAINTSRLLRYASRRGKKQEISDAIKKF